MQQAHILKPLTIAMIVAGFSTCAFAMETSKDHNKNIEDQTEPYQLERVTVKGLGFEQDVSQAAASVSTITARELNTTHTNKIEDLGSQIVGLSTGKNYAGGSTRIFIRGQGDYMDLEGLRVGVYVDGTYMPLNEIQNLNLGDVEQIEVLKGAQNVLYGPFAEAGAINVITKKPEATGGSVSVGVANHNSLSAKFNYDHVISDSATVGVFLQQIKNGGWVKNLTTGNKLAGEKSSTIALKGFFSPSSNTDIETRLYWTKNNTDGPLVALINANTLKPFERQVSYNLVTVPGLPQPIPVPQYNDTRNIPFGAVTLSFDPYTKTDTGGGTLKVTHRMNELTFTSNTGVIRSHLKFKLDGDATTEAMLHQDVDHKVLGLNQEFKLSYEKDNIKWLAGLSGYYTGQDKLSTWAVMPPDHFKYYRKGIGAFGQISYGVTDNLILTGGARVQYDAAHAKQLTDPIFVPPGTPKANKKMSHVSVVEQLRASYFITPNIQVYGSVATGYKPGDFYPIFGYDSYERESSFMQEVGFKAHWLDDRLYTGLALFHNDVKNFQSADFRVNNSTVTNIGRVDIRGVEAELRFKPIRELEFGTSVAYNYSKIKEFKNPDSIGKRIPWAPLWNWNTWANVTYNTSFGKLNWYTEWTMFGKAYAGYANEFKLNPYGLLNTTLGWKYRGHEVQLWGKNLFNKEYYTTAFDARSTPYQALWATYGKTRTFGVNYTYRF